MKTPIYDFVQNYRKQDVSRLHMPGHKGHVFLGCEEIDITEIHSADSLYEASGIIAESENLAASLFESGHIYYSTEGSSQCIKAMLYLTLQQSRTNTDMNRPVLLAARNVHKAFVHTCALNDLDVTWMYPDEDTSRSICSCVISPAQLERSILAMPHKAIAVYVTSPDYLGIQMDIAGLSRICQKYDLPFLVDNAHGAYLKFLPVSQHPMDLGATMCCDSGHKTLPVLTGGAYLHISKEAPLAYSANARSALSLFGSTSPSYLVLQSLDLCNRYLDDHYSSRLSACIKRIALLRDALLNNGCVLIGSEPLKIVIDSSAMGLQGIDIADLLRENQVECEYADTDYVVLMFTPENSEKDYHRVADICSSLSPQVHNNSQISINSLQMEPVMSIRQAVFSNHERILIELAEGRICSAPTVSCPPAVPIAISGEIITSQTIQIFKHYGISFVDVVSKE